MDLPVEIETHLLSYLHPYHLGIYSQVCKQSYEIACSLTPSISKSLLNYTTDNLSTLVELSLVYHPIPESVKYYDRMTLFYHACRTQQQDVLCYLNGKYNQRVMYILWKFQRYKEAIILYKTCRININDDISVLLLLSLYISYRHEFEIKGVIIHEYKYNYDFPGYFSAYDKALLLASSRFVTHRSNAYNDAFKHSLNEKQISNVNNTGTRGILPKPEYSIESTPNIYIETCPDIYKGIHYLFSGQFLSYVEWRKSHQLVADTRDHVNENVKSMIVAEEADRLIMSINNVVRSRIICSINAHAFKFFSHLTLNMIGLPSHHPDVKKIMNVSNLTPNYIII